MTLKDKEIDGFGIVFNKSLLSNGVSVYSFYKSGSPISFRAYFYAGSQFDGDKPGLAHFCEHILVGGTEKYPTKDLLNEKIQDIGAKRNAFTNKKVTFLTMDVADNSDLPEMFGVVDEILNHSRYDERIVNAERGAILAEQTKSRSNQSQYIYEIRSSLLFQDTEIENTILGTEEVVKNLTDKELRDYYEKYLKNGQVAYFVSGDFDLKCVLGSLEGINRSRRPIILPKKPLKISSERKEYLATVASSEQDYISLCSRLSPIMNKEDMALSHLFLNIFGSNNTSRLYKTLRSEKGLVYNVNAELFNNDELCYFSVNTNCKVKDTKKVVETIRMEFMKIIKEGINEKELSLAKKAVIRNFKFNFETSASWVDSYAMNSLALNSDVLLPNEIIEIVNRATVNDVNSFLNKYLAGNELLLAGVGSFND